MKRLKNLCANLVVMQFKNFSFGATSAVITALALLIGLEDTMNAKINIITALVVIAIADNISDSFGIHIHQESQNTPANEVRKTTFINFFTRLLIVLLFILIIMYLPVHTGIVVSIIFGFSVISILSYFIAINHNENPYKSIFFHLGLATLVMIGSYFLRKVILEVLPKILA